jgi:hypothetical protein
MYEHKIVLKTKKRPAIAASQNRVRNLRENISSLSNIGRSEPNQTNNISADIENVDNDIFEKGMVIFHSTPEVSEQGNVLYVDISDIRAAGSHSVYLGSPARTFNINHKFISRTRIEAENTWRMMNTLRAWRMPKTGLAHQGINVEDLNADTNAPSVLNLFGYGKTFRGIPVVITSLTIDWNSESDYIKCNNGSDIPIILPVSISLKEMRTYNDMNSTFNYEQFKKGELRWW